LFIHLHHVKTQQNIFLFDSQQSKVIMNRFCEVIFPVTNFKVVNVLHFIRKRHQEAKFCANYFRFSISFIVFLSKQKSVRKTRKNSNIIFTENTNFNMIIFVFFFIKKQYWQFLFLFEFFFCIRKRSITFSVRFFYGFIVHNRLWMFN